MNRRSFLKSIGPALAAVVLFMCLTLCGCAGACGDVSADNATERGLSYIAAAIVTHAVIGAIFRD